MKQKQTTCEDQERPVIHQCARSGWRLAADVPRRSAVGALGIDLAFRNGAQREQRRYQQQNGDDEDRARRKEIAACAHRGRSKAVADRGKARIATEPLANRGVSDEAEADCGQCRAEDATRRGMQD